MAPRAPIKLPLRADFGEDKPFKARMKHTPAARKVQMTQMPQLVALFNGVGGGAAALVAIVEYLKLGEEATTAVVIATVFTVIVGCVSFSGSIITFLKLQELMTTRPVIFPFGRQIIAPTKITP